MVRFRRPAVGFLLIAGFAAGVFGWWQARRQGPMPPLRVGIWYWHTPFKVGPAELKELRTMGVDELFVRAGTFRADGSAVRMTMPQRWDSSADGLGIHLVFNFDYGIVRGYAGFDNAAIERAVISAANAAAAEARRAGLSVVGVQLDFDCPTRRLPKYAALLRALHREIERQHLALSITALQSWFKHGEVREVMEAVDFTAPQYYEAEIPRSLDKLSPISRLDMMRDGLRAAGRTGLPFRAGLPAYGHATVYDRSGRLVGMFRDMGLDDVARRPTFRNVRSFACDASGKPALGANAIGEEIHEYVAYVPASDSGQTGYHVVFDLPTPELVRQHVALLRAERPRNCAGVILFRYPEPGEAATLPLRSLAAAWRGERAAPDIRVRVEVVSAPWEIVDTGRKAARAPIEVNLVVANVGTASTFLASDGVTVWLALDKAGAEEAEARGADEMETYYQAGLRPGAPCTEAGLRASVPRANVFRFTRMRLAAGETARMGTIRLPSDGAIAVWGEWNATAAAGASRLHGSVPVTPIAPTEQK